MRHTTLSLQKNTSFPAAMPDVRGYEVRTRDQDHKVGKVSDLVCTPEGEIRYLDVGLGGLFNRKRVLLPVGVARVDRQNDIVWVAGMTQDQVKELPDYDGNPETITEDYEAQCCGPYLGKSLAAGAGVTTAAELYDQGRFYAERDGDAARKGRLSFGTDAADRGSGAGPARRDPSGGGEARL